MFGISGGEFVVLLVIAAVVLGPERLPDYAQQLARLVRELRRMAQGASAQVRSELGPEFDDIDWAKLDPRQYDPRRIVREALADVWNPDDPLGLKESEAPPTREDLDTDWMDDEASAVGDRDHDDEPPDDGGTEPGAPPARRVARLGLADGIKPQSPGGPRDVTPVADEDGVSAGATAGRADGGRAAPAFDPDAT